MEINPGTLGKFETWLIGRGRVESTARVYKNHLRRSAGEADGLTARLVDGSLSPNTRRTNLAALASWAKFARDADLRAELDDIRLPPARRVKAKIPLDLEAWRVFVQHVMHTSTERPLRRNPTGAADAAKDARLRTAELRREALRRVILMIAIRGIRCGDVLRMTRKDLTNAVATKVLVFEGKGRKLTRFAAGPILEHIAALVAMKKWERVSDLVTTGDSRAALTRVERAVKRYAKEADIADVFPHRFRTTYATAFLRRLQGDPQALIKLQRHMDWESLATAARYADAVDADSLDEIGADMTEALTR
jgi:integrase